jgi:hypothetical protein
MCLLGSGQLAQTGRIINNQIIAAAQGLKNLWTPYPEQEPLAPSEEVF